MTVGLGLSASFLLSGSLVGLPGDDPEIEKLEQRLRSRDKWVRKSAVERLARDGRPQAWEWVVERLGDPAGEVADTAEACLSRVDQVVPDSDDRIAIVKRLRGRDGVASDEAWTRRRTWGVVARLSPRMTVEGLGKVGWKKGLGDREPAVRALALDAVASWFTRGGPSVDPGGFGVLFRRAIERGLGARDPEVVVAAALAAGASGDAGLMDEARALSGSDEPRIRAVGGALAFDGDRGVEAWARAMSDAEPAVRAAAILASGGLDLEGVARPLVEALADPRHAVRRWAHEVLVARSGYLHPPTSRAWQAWAQAPTAIEPRERPDPERSVAFAEYVPPSDRVVFLLDFSGSIWREREDGTRPRDDLVVATRRLFERLDETVEFDVGVFTSDVEFHQARLRAARSSRVKRAARFVEDARQSGSGDAWGAIEQALAIEGADTLVLLTDGEPTGGRRHRLEHFPEHWRRLTRGRPVRMEVLLVEAPPRIHRAWQAVADHGRGRVREATL